MRVFSSQRSIMHTLTTFTRNEVSDNETNASTDFLEKCIDAFIIVSYDAKPLFSDQRHLMKFIIFFYVKESNIHSEIHRKIVSLVWSLLFHNTYRVSNRIIFLNG
jgi:hypothetical protein